MKNKKKQKIQFKFHDEYGLSLPLLVLAIGGHEEHPCTEFKFKKTRTFLPLQHQTAGLGCHQHYMFATVLKPRHPEKIKKLCDHWYESNAGIFSASLNEVNEYRTEINDLFGVDCNGTYTFFEEGLYPIDLNEGSLEKMCIDRNLPKELDDLVIWESKMHRIFGFIGRWKLFILGENSD